MLRKHFNATTIIAIVALVFAMTGGAFAVTSKGSGSPSAVAAKKKVKKKGKAKVLRGPTGATGPAGPAGPQGPVGPAGAKGETGVAGKDGSNGSNGKDGTSVAMTALGAGEGGCAAGGQEFSVGASKGAACNGTNGESVKVEAITANAANANCKEGGAKVSNAGGEAFACNGEAAKGPLQAGETETGLWSGAVTTFSTTDFKSYIGFAPITFARPTTTLSKARVIYEKQSNPTGCTGTFENPAAESGYLCIYVYVEEGLPASAISPFRQTHAGNLVVLKNSTSAAGWAMGSWAVTG